MSIQEKLSEVRSKLQTEKHSGKLRNLRAHELELTAALKSGSVIATAPGSAIGEAARIRKSLIGCADSAKLAAGVKRIRELEGRGNLFEKKEFQGTPLEKMNALLAMGVKIFLLIALASLVSSASAQYASISDGALSPRYGVNKIVGAYSGSGFSVTNLHSSATNVNVTIDARFQSSVGLTVIAAMNGAGPSTLTIPYQRSPDGVNFDTTLQTIALSFGAGTNAVLTNITMYGMGYVRIPYVTNSSGTVDCTNLVLLSPTKALSTPP